MKVTFIKYYKRVSIWQEIERNEFEMSENEINAMVTFFKMSRLHQGRYDYIEAYGKQTACDERLEIIINRG